MIWLRDTLCALMQDWVCVLDICVYVEEQEGYMCTVMMHTARVCAQVSVYRPACVSLIPFCLSERENTVCSLFSSHF